jgi:Mn2+/Fe2+ NRAMP family transporter
VLLPVVLGFLLSLERRALLGAHRMAGGYKWIAWTLAGLVMALGVYTALTALRRGRPNTASTRRLGQPTEPARACT